MSPSSLDIALIDEAANTSTVQRVEPDSPLDFLSLASLEASINSESFIRGKRVDMIVETNFLVSIEWLFGDHDLGSWFGVFRCPTLDR